MAAALTKQEKKAAKFKNRMKQTPNVPEDCEAGVLTEEQQPKEPAKTEVVKEEDKMPDQKRDESIGGSDDIEKPLKRRSRSAKSKTRTVYDEEGVPHTVKVAAPKEELPKYIVFVGNMAFDVTGDMLAKHMASFCGETPTVRLLTTKGHPDALNELSNSKKKSIAKGKAQDPSAPRSRGCAFVEFTNATALQKALRFHHTTFHGRAINVELTAGGGGKSQQRKDKIKKKNESLQKERVR